MNRASGYIPHIDGLRALSVLLVILFHFEIGPVSGGFVGVDVFFTISGFLIIGSIVSLSSQRRFSALDFWQRRIRRLLPAILATLTLSLLAGFLIMNPDDLQHLARQSLFGLFSLINFTALRDVDYFALDDASEPLVHFWSLAVEEQFYLIFPPIALLTGVLLANRQHYRSVMIGVLLTLSALSLIGAEYALSQGHNLFAYYMMPTRFAQLALGGVLAIALQTGKFQRRAERVPAWAHDLLVVAGLGVIVYCALAFTIQTRFPGLNAMLPTAGALAVLFSGGHSRLRALLENPASTYVGRLSYSLYLVHWPVWTFLSYYLARDLGIAETGLALALTFALSALIFHFIETPFRFASNFGGAKLYRGVVPGMLVVIAAAASMIGFNGWAFRVEPERRQFIADSRQFHRENFGGLGYSNGEVIHLGHPGAAPDFIIFGDSKARHFASGLDAALQERNRAALGLFHDGCPFVLTLMRVDEDGEPYGRCRQVSERVLDLVAGNPIPVVSARSWWGYRPNFNSLEGQPLSFEAEGFNDLYADAHADFHARVRALLPPDQPIYVIGEKLEPQTLGSIAGCMARPGWLGLPCRYRAGATADSYFFSPVARRFSEALATMENAHYIPMQAVYCNDGWCDQIADDGAIMFSDPNHLSQAGSRRLAPRLLSLIGVAEAKPEINPDHPEPGSRAHGPQPEDIRREVIAAYESGNMDRTNALLDTFSEVSYREQRERFILDVWRGENEIAQNQSLAFHIAEHFAETGETVPVFIASFALYAGAGTEKDWEASLRYMNHPALASNHLVTYRRATVYLDETLEVYDRERGMELLRQAAGEGVEEAQTLLRELEAERADDSPIR